MEVATVVQDNDAKYQSNPLALPHGFFYVRGPLGQKLGFGFWCGKCKLHIPGRLTTEVRHCGRVSAPPKGVLESIKLTKRGRRDLYEGLSQLEREAYDRFWANVKTVRKAITL
jgi:hypothetical protein